MRSKVTRKSAHTRERADYSNALMSKLPTQHHPAPFKIVGPQREVEYPPTYGVCAQKGCKVISTQVYCSEHNQVVKRGIRWTPPEPKPAAPRLRVKK